MLTKGVQVFFVSLFASVIVEFVSWALLYRTDEYKRLKSQLLRTEKKLEVIRQSSSANAKAKNKKESKQEDLLKTRMKGIQKVHLTTSVITGVFLFVFYQVLTATYDGVVVGKLPFKPFSFVSTFTHRGLLGSNKREVSVAFIYVLCQYSTKVLVGKVFNFGISARLERAVGKDDTTSSWGKPGVKEIKR